MSLVDVKKEVVVLSSHPWGFCLWRTPAPSWRPSPCRRLLPSRRPGWPGFPGRRQRSPPCPGQWLWPRWLRVRWRNRDSRWGRLKKTQNNCCYIQFEQTVAPHLDPLWPSLNTSWGSRCVLSRPVWGRSPACRNVPGGSGHWGRQSADTSHNALLRRNRASEAGLPPPTTFARELWEAPMSTYWSKASGKLVAPMMITPSFGLNLQNKDHSVHAGQPHHVATPLWRHQLFLAKLKGWESRNLLRLKHA